MPDAGQRAGRSGYGTGEAAIEALGLIALKRKVVTADALHWNIRPSRTGLVLSPEVGGMSQGCAVDLLLDFRDTRSYIKDEALGCAECAVQYLNGAPSRYKENNPEMDMHHILSDQEKFRTKFCSEATIRNLAGIGSEHLREVLLKIHQLADFNAINTLDKWTPEGSPQTVVSIGCMKGGGKGQVKMEDPRFGICTDARAEATSGATRLYLWVDHRALDRLPDNTRPFPREGSPFNWRSGENGRADPAQKFYQISDPLYSTEGGHRDFAEIRIKGEARVVSLPDLLKGLGKLLERPTKIADQAVAPHAQKLGLEQGCYTPAAIGEFNKKIREARAKARER